jgi:hypothetical protein
MNECQSCGRPAQNDSYQAFPYCRTCYYSGEAYSAINEPLLSLLAAAGFPAKVVQTGGGCQNYLVALTEGGYDGPHAYLGEAVGDLADWSRHEVGVALMAHPEDRWLMWVDETVGCTACHHLAELERDLNTECRDLAHADTEAAATWMVAVAKRLAKAVAAHHTHG